MSKIWKQKGIERSALISQLQKKYPDIIARLLAERGVANISEAEKFLNPQYELSHDPYLLQDMEKAVERIFQALSRNEQITVYADYDADAVTATAILLRFFQQIGYEKVDYYIPDRFSEGYGMNVEAIAELAKRGTKLIVTVDCGINAFEAVDAAKKFGLNVIITDHHQLISSSPSPDQRAGDGLGERILPDAFAVINPHRKDDKYPFKDLTGAGVAFKLAQALEKKLEIASLRGVPARGLPQAREIPQGGDWKLKIPPVGWSKWLLDLVAIGTVADCQSLLGENRILVKWGLHVMRKTRWTGLRKLLEEAGIFGQPLDSYKIGFIIAPRINAAGRIRHANLALDLLLCDDVDEAEKLSEQMGQLNQMRQRLAKQVLSEAREQIAISRQGKVLLAFGENWPKGIVGLVAGKLSEEYCRPALVMSHQEGEATGSARSIGGFDIVEAIGRSRELLLRYGGHAAAAGFSLRTEHIETFYENLLAHAEVQLSEEDLSPSLVYETEIKSREVSDELVEFIEKLEPFGIGNPRPIFRVNNMIIRFRKKVGSDEKHLQMFVAHDQDGATMRGISQTLSCIGFNLGFWADKLKEGDEIDAVCELAWNDWNNERRIQLKITDLKFSKKADNTELTPKK